MTNLFLINYHTYLSQLNILVNKLHKKLLGIGEGIRANAMLTLGNRSKHFKTILMKLPSDILDCVVKSVS